MDVPGNQAPQSEEWNWKPDKTNKVQSNFSLWKYVKYWSWFPERLNFITALCNLDISLLQPLYLDTRETKTHTHSTSVICSALIVTDSTISLSFREITILI